jgi:DNA-binding MarR family transcriptional regulator
MIDIAHNEARHLSLLYRQMMKDLERDLAPLELGPGRYLYLFGLYIQDGRKQQDLADAIGIDKAAVTRALARLEQAGYITRKNDPNDGRAMRIYLTSKARQLRPQLEDAAISCIATMTKALDTDEQIELRRLLAKMTQSLGSES